MTPVIQTRPEIPEPGKPDPIERGNFRIPNSLDGTANTFEEMAPPDMRFAPPSSSFIPKS